jgi:hypothetical protein
VAALGVGLGSLAGGPGPARTEPPARANVPFSIAARLN